MRVPINNDNIRHCRCPQCPVQAKSECAKEKLAKINNSSNVENFDQAQATLLYCSIGRSICEDLDYDQKCICPTCLVWNDYDLQSYKYCLNGDAEEIG